jgi:hypothetical protein
LSGGISRFSFGDAGRGYRVGELGKKLVVLAIIDADTAFDRHRQVARLAQAAHAICHQFWAQHQTRTERAVLDAIARAAHIEIDLGIAGRRADAGRRGQLDRIATAQLQGDGVLARIVRQQPRSVPAHEGRRDDHFRVQQRVRRVQAMQVAAVSVGPLHHWSDADAAI